MEFICNESEFELGQEGQFIGLKLHGARFEFPLGYTLYEVSGHVTDSSLSPVQEVATDDSVPSRDGEAMLTLSGAGRTWKLRLTAGDQLSLRPEGREWEESTVASVTVPFPVAAEILIPEGHNLGRRIDEDMPAGEQYHTRPGYSFVLVKCGDIWLRIHSTDQNSYQLHARGSLGLSRQPDLFLLTWSWRPGNSDLHLALFSSMDAAIADYRDYLQKEVGIRTLSERKELPAWVRKVSLVFIIDMMRSHGVISHDYKDVARMARDLRDAGCPNETLFYLPGWAGPYDAVYPTCEPHIELGGDQAFREMIDSLHECGYRVMIHTNPWGVDPFHPDIDRYLQYVLKDPDGKYAGFQTVSRTKWGIISPDFRRLMFWSGRVKFSADSDGKTTFTTLPVPDRVEAVLTLGGIRGDGRLSVTIGRRTHRTPAGAFAKGNEHVMEFPFLLEPGPNRIVLSAEGDLDLSHGWYAINECRVPPDRYATWTYPILFADTQNAEWQQIFVENVTAVVKTYAIDAIHCDATEYELNKPIYTALTERLPRLPVSGEGYGTLSAMGYFAFAQSGQCQTLTGHLDAMKGTQRQGAVPDVTKLDEELAWLNKESAVTSFVSDYIRIYPHLCAANAFVPVGTVCNHSAPLISPRDPSALWSVLHDAKRLGFVPALRLNYREYGLDSETRKAINELSAQS